MKQWWFWYAISQLIQKLIILQLLFIYFNYAFNQIINYCTLLPPNSDSMCCKAASLGAEGAPGDVHWRICYVLIWHGVVYAWCWLYG